MSERDRNGSGAAKTEIKEGGGDGRDGGIEEERKLEGGRAAWREIDVKWWVRGEGGSARQACGHSDRAEELRERHERRSETGDGEGELLVRCSRSCSTA